MYSEETAARLMKSAEEKIARLDEIEARLADPAFAKDGAGFRELAREAVKLRRLKELREEFERTRAHLAESEHLISDPATEPDLRKMARHEAEKLAAERDGLVECLEETMCPKDPFLEKNVIIEVRAGTGGVEASLFAAEIFRMYTRYAAACGFKVEVLSQSATEAGGVREVIFSVAGDGAFGRFRFESGVHRVQRVPVTEASGRIHTSAVTVAVLPEAEEIEVNIKPEELKVDVFRSGGPGGQSVNTTDSAVRVTHVPTGLVVKCQDEKSQLKNKVKALQILRARLFDHYQRESQRKIARTRRSQVGTGDRSEKIRTYNFPERRVTDHRIGFTTHTLDRVLEGDLDPVVDALKKASEEIG